jgi:ADP-L-glycero-D-manno-heptose 6-epimerase
VILVTGAAGFIGSCIAAKLNERGEQNLILVDHLNHPQKENNLQNKKYKEYIEKDVFLRRVQTDDFKEPVSCVIHMGACSSTTLQDEEYFRQNNLEYTRTLCQWALKKNIRFIYASSAATYGDGSIGYCDDDATTLQCKPLNFYGWSKQHFDLWVLKEKLGGRVAGLKFFNVFGPNEYHKGDMRSVVAKAYERVHREGTMALFKSYHPDYPDGGQKRDFIYVKDAVDVVLFFYDHPSINGIFNVGTGQARTWNDVAHALFAAVGQQPRIEYIDMPPVLRGKYQYYTQADMKKLRRAGFTQAFIPLEAAIKDYAGYLKEHKHY